MKYLFFVLFVCFFSTTTAQHQDKVDFTHAEATIEVIPQEKSVRGLVTYKFKVLQNVDSIFLDAKNMAFTSVKLDVMRTAYTNDNSTISIKNTFKKGDTHTLLLQYSCKPKQTLYFIGWDDVVLGNEQVWTQGQGKYTSYWLPSFDDMNEKVEFDLNFTGQLENRTIIANGLAQKVQSNHEGGFVTAFDMKKPMSSYLLAFVIGTYDKTMLVSDSGIPIINYYYPQDSTRVEPTFRYTKRIFDFLETEIGVPYPWQNYKQIPVKDFLYAGMENTGTTIFSDGYVIDSTAFIDKNYVNVNAHEMAHQWFGNLVTEKNGSHHWLQEGFATYFAYLAEKRFFGNDHYYWKLYRSFKELEATANRGEGQSLLDPKASSLTFYEKGALALHMLRVEVGDKAFRKGIKSYLEKFKFKNVTVSDFLEVMENTTKKDLSEFREKWLESADMPSMEVKNEFVKNSESLKQIFVLELDFKNAGSDVVDFMNYWNTTKSIHFKKFILSKYLQDLPDEIIKEAFASDTLLIRQQLAITNGIKRFAKKDYESLLTDESYVTVESALIRLWSTYPEERAAYLDVTKDLVGLPNKNLRLLWLTLATLTEGYNIRMTKQYFDELSNYTSPIYSFEIRQTAFEYLKEAFGLTDQNLLDLMQATNHHAWQFKKFSRNLLDNLLNDQVYKERIVALMDKLKPLEKRYIESKLN